MINPSISEKNRKTKRLFLALLPDHRITEKLIQLQKEIPGRKTPRENLHLTLAFLGNQPVSVLSGLINFLNQVEFAPFSLRLDKIGYFPKIRLSWVGPSMIPEALNKLYRTTQQFLVPAYTTTMEKTFRPHITLARQSALPHMKMDVPIIWDINRLALMQSVQNTETGGHPQYHILHEVIAAARHQKNSLIRLGTQTENMNAIK